MGALALHHLEAGDIDKAFILARLGYRDLTIEAWRNMAAATLDQPPGGSGILFAQTAAGHAKGLLLYTIAPTVAGKPSLRVERLIAFDLIDPGAVADALVAEVLRIARLRDCETFSLVAPLDTPTDASALVLASPVSVLHKVF